MAARLSSGRSEQEGVEVEQGTLTVTCDAVPGRGDSQSKGPEAGLCLACWSSKE